MISQFNHAVPSRKLILLIFEIMLITFVIFSKKIKWMRTIKYSLW